MNIEESNLLLASYRQMFGRSQAMLNKIHELETTIYSAQAGLVENETGCRVSGGNHISRTESIANLVDTKDHYYKYYNECENACKNILKLIQKIFTNRDETQPELNEKESHKAQLYENVLINYYINKSSQNEIASTLCYEIRHIQRLLAEARKYFYMIFKDNDYKALVRFLKEVDTNNIIVNYSNLVELSNSNNNNNIVNGANCV